MQVDPTSSCKVIAHRGASGSAPENTLAAISMAVEMGVDLVEIDVRPSKDGAIVVFHDKRLSRTSNGHGKVIDHTLAELQKLDAGSWFSSTYKNEGIPTLEQVIQAVDQRCKLLVEVKGGDQVKPLFAKQLVRLIQRYEAHDWILVQSFSQRLLEMVHRLDPAVSLNKLIVYQLPKIPLHYSSRIQFGNAYRDKLSIAINPSLRYYNKRVGDSIKKQNREVYIWTVNSESSMKRLIELGVDGIITNYPEKLLQLLGR